MSNPEPSFWQRGVARAEPILELQMSNLWIMFVLLQQAQHPKRPPKIIRAAAKSTSVSMLGTKVLRNKADKKVGKE